MDPSTIESHMTVIEENHAIERGILIDRHTQSVRAMISFNQGIRKIFTTLFRLNARDADHERRLIDLERKLNG